MVALAFKLCINIDVALATHVAAVGLVDIILGKYAPNPAIQGEGWSLPDRQWICVIRHRMINMHGLKQFLL